ncbi:hypothetical protein [Xenorhabdus bharatensis]|uniref:hypothetical protein n=1 Tax=Xenorhabdus bharatensis TaxID=3136256 RepID=UPI0030F462C3
MYGTREEPFGGLLMKVQFISSEEYDQSAPLKLQSLKAILAESIALADCGQLHSIDDVFASLTVDELESKA